MLSVWGHIFTLIRHYTVYLHIQRSIIPHKYVSFLCQLKSFKLRKKLMYCILHMGCLWNCAIHSGILKTPPKMYMMKKLCMDFKTFCRKINLPFISIVRELFAVPAFNSPSLLLRSENFLSKSERISMVPNHLLWAWFCIYLAEKGDPLWNCKTVQEGNNATAWEPAVTGSPSFLGTFLPAYAVIDGLPP